MKTTILEIYALAVCFCTLICFAIVLGIALYDIVQIIWPEFTSAYDPQGEYWKEREKGEAVQSMVKMGIIIIVDLMIFIPHWLIAKKARINRAINT